MNIKVVVWQEDDVWCANVPALSGCHTWAENYDDLMVMVKEAIEGWLEVSHEKNYLKLKSVPFSRRLNYN